MEPRKIATFFLITPLIALVILNLVLVFMPEIGFDALWYHLTLPKLWLLKHQWYFPGGLLYYSAMPRLSETLFIPLISLFGTFGPKLLQFLSGIFICIYIWKIAADLKMRPLSRLVSISCFYATWLVSWESGSAYIDLIRSFLEVAALYYALRRSWWLSGLLIGLAIGTKWFALFTLVLLSTIFSWQVLPIALITAAPWFAIALIYTGNPIYPIFGRIPTGGILPFSQILSNLVGAPYVLTKPFDDFISPIVGIIFIFSIVSVFLSPMNIRKIAIFGLVGTFISLTLNPPSARFFIPYFPALIIVAVYAVEKYYSKFIPSLVLLVILSSFFITGLRIYAVKKYLPIIFQGQTWTDFLTTNYARLPGTFIDSDGFVGSHLSNKDKIIIDKLHNLYYFPYNFDHTSWGGPLSSYDYLITTETINDSNLFVIHENQLGIKVYKITK